MTESLALTAFFMGIISAASLPIGAATSAFWRPEDRAIAFLMAFGGGALLAALTIDLVGSAVAKGRFYELAAGCILGGLLFISLNQIINDYGGFLRKVSTTIYHLRRQEHRRVKHILSSLGRIGIFEDLTPNEFKALAYSIRTERTRKGNLIFRPGDPPDALYVVTEGSVELLDPKRGMRCVEQLRKNDAFGSLALLTGSPYAKGAKATEDTVLWVVPRNAFWHLVPTSQTLMQAVHRELRSTRLWRYLEEQHELTAEKIQDWSDTAVASLARTGRIPDAVPVERKPDEFCSYVKQITRLPIFVGLPPEELEALSSRIIFKRHQRGDTFFHKGDPADRMYIIEHGEVSLIDPQYSGRKPTVVHDHDAFGTMSFLTGVRHSVSAMATEDTRVWVLRKSDFDELLTKSPILEQHVRVFIEHDRVSSYLEHKHHFDPDRAARWTHRAVKSIDSGKLIPAATTAGVAIENHKGAALAIWLGILLDGIPESLVIGASLIHGHVSLSLLAGLFLSNYPEALSSSVGMRQQGFSFPRILMMWTLLMIITGIGAALGNIFFIGAPPGMFALVEGIAAGAMLTMIAQTMLPEAYFKGGSIIGFSTLLGFLAAIWFKTLE